MKKLTLFVAFLLISSFSKIYAQYCYIYNNIDSNLTFTLWAQDGCSYTSCGALQSNTFTVRSLGSLLITDVTYLNGSGTGGAYWLGSASACTTTPAWNYVTVTFSACGTVLVGTQCGGYPTVTSLAFGPPCDGMSNHGHVVWSQDAFNNVTITVEEP